MRGDHPTEARARFPAASRGAASLLLLLLVLLGGVSCASSDEQLSEEMQAQRNQALAPVSPADIARYPAGSPERTVLTIWRALQFHDLATATSLLSPPPPRELVPAVEGYLLGPAAELTATAKPRVTGVRREGNEAVTVLRVARRVEEGNRVITRVGAPVELTLERSEGRWVLPWRKALPQLGAALL